MTPLMMLVLSILSFIAVIFLIFIGVMVGKFGSTNPSRPPMTMAVLDLSGIQYGLNAKLRWIKYHPSTGFWKQGVDMPTEKGKVQVIERSGFFGFRKDTWVWDENSIMLIGEKKGGWAIYRPEFLNVLSKEKMEKLDHAHRTLQEDHAELIHQLESAQRNVRAQVEEGIDKGIKRVKEITPAPLPRGKSMSGGGQR